MKASRLGLAAMLLSIALAGPGCATVKLNVQVGGLLVAYEIGRAHV